MAIYTSMGEQVEIVGGPYSRPVGRLDFRVETFMVRSLNDRAWRVERARGELKADGGAQEIEAAIAAMMKKEHGL